MFYNSYTLIIAEVEDEVKSRLENKPQVDLISRNPIRSNDRVKIFYDKYGLDWKDRYLTKDRR